MLTSDRLSGVLAGRLVYPEDREWETARRVFNLLLDQQPVAVAFPSDERDVTSVMALVGARVRLVPALGIKRRWGRACWIAGGGPS